MLLNQIMDGGAGKAGHILIPLSLAPCMIGSGDLANVFIAKFPAGPVDHVAQLARINEQDFAAPVAHFLVTVDTVGFILGKGPEAPIIELGNPGDIEIITNLLSSDAVKAKSEVLIEIWGGEKPLRGRVLPIDPYGFIKISALGVEEQRVNVIIDLVDPPAARKNLGHGYRVIVRVVEWSGKDVLQVPISALFPDRGQ